MAPTQTIEVIAPSDLAGGYEFTVQVGGKSFLVQVPNEGVKEGQVFRAAIMEQTLEKSPSVLSDDPHRIPRGRWRDGCLACCRNGCCHPVCCLATFCHPIVLGQVMTRMQLDPLAIPYSNKYRPNWSAFRIMLLVFICFFAFDRSLHVFLKSQAKHSKDAAGFVFVQTLRLLARFSYGCYIWFCLWKTRGVIRQRYQIPPSCVEDSCGRIEDAACAFCFPCCTVAQLSRHTADFSTYHSACCTETGLPERAPSVVVG